MAHEIGQHDKVVLHRTQAWHGLGIVVQDAPTPLEALRIADLDWDVCQWPLYATDGEGNRIAVEDSVLNVRSDTRTELGIVGAGWQPIQNRELAEFCAALAQQGDRVLIESAGSIRNGRKVWFLIKGESFSVRGGDEVTPYICASCGHDGLTALRLTPTTVRVVCSNTLHMVIPDHDQADRGGGDRLPRRACYVVRHCGKIDQKIQEARAALALYGQSLAAMRERIDCLSAREVSSSQVQGFFLEMYTRHFGAVPSNPQDAIEQRRRDHAMGAIAAMVGRFESDRPLAGTTAWGAMNAYTGWLQNDRPLRGKDPVRAREKQVHSRLFGVDADRSLEAFAVALAL
jgi:phage/plasmid-like protein (TIGR03299 family)